MYTKMVMVICPLFRAIHHPYIAGGEESFSSFSHAHSYMHLSIYMMVKIVIMMTPTATTILVAVLI